jgi:Na+/melibiose symporter-like transporter
MAQGEKEVHFSSRQAADDLSSSLSSSPLVPDERVAEPALPNTLKVTLFCIAVSQYIGSSSISLFVMLDLSFEPTQLTHYWMYMSWVYWLNPVVGWACDELVIRFERRRPFALIGVVVNVICFLLIAEVEGVCEYYALFLLVSGAQTLAQQMVSVPLNALVVEQGQGSECGSRQRTARISALQGEAMMWRTAGSLVGAILQTLLLLVISTRRMLVVTAVAYLLFALPTLVWLPAGLFTQWAKKTSAAEGRSHWASFREKWVETCAALQHRCRSTKDEQSGVIGLLLVLVFVFFYSSMPDGSIIYLSFLAYRFDFSAAFLSLNLCVGLIGSIAGSYAFSRYMQHRHKQERGLVPGQPVTNFFLFSIGSVAWSLGYATNIMLATGFSLHSLHIPNVVFVPIDNAVTSMLSRLAFMPVLAVAAEKCPAGYEAVIFELFTAASMGGSSVSALVTAVIATLLTISRHNYNNLWALLVVSAGGKLLPVVLAAFLPSPPKATSERHVGREGEGEEPSVSPGKLSPTADLLVPGAADTSSKVSC